MRRLETCAAVPFCRVKRARTTRRWAWTVASSALLAGEPLVKSLRRGQRDASKRSGAAGAAGLFSCLIACSG